MKRKPAGVQKFIMKNASKCPLVIVEWVDSSYAPGWLTQADADEPQIKRCCSVGWIRKRTRDAIVLTANMTMEENPHRCCEITIPRCAIQEIHRL